MPPPPRYKMRSGAFVRVAMIAAMLGLGVWGYTQFNDPNAPELVAEEQTQVADNMRPDGGYAVTPTPDTATTPAPAPAAPATESAPQPRSAPAAPPAEPTPPPSTTIGGEAGR